MEELAKLRRALRDSSHVCGYEVYCEALRELIVMAQAMGFTLDEVNKAEEALK